MIALNADSGALPTPYFSSATLIRDRAFAPAFSLYNASPQQRCFSGVNKFWVGHHADSFNQVSQQKPSHVSAQQLTSCPPKNIDSCSTQKDSLFVTKQKTPMTQVVEIARFNHVNHQYVLQNESGPAHRKTFVVKLILGENEQFEGEGLSIKKAQQNAAAKAVEQTNLSKPPQATTKKSFFNSGVVSPTVRLNSMLIKMNLSAEYANFSTYHPRAPALSSNSNQYFDPFLVRSAGLPFYPDNAPFFRFGPRPMAPSTFCYGPPPVHTVRLKIGRLDFFGKGPSRQAARHDAAQQAIAALQSFYSKQQTENYPDSHVAANEAEKIDSVVSASDKVLHSQSPSEPAASPSDTLTVEKRAKAPDAPVCQIGTAPGFIGDMMADLTESLSEAAKSPISIIHELASRAKMTVEFEVISESGPAHNRLFVVEVQLVRLQDEKSLLSHRGSGPSKKLAKNDACAKFIQVIVKNDQNLFANYLLIVNCKPSVKPPKSKRETIIKDSKMDPNYGEEINPITRLVQVQQAKKATEPRFELVQEVGQGRYKEYVMQVIVGEDYCEASGPNKKLAKRSAAELMLEKMGLNKPLPKAGKPVLKQPKMGLNSEFSYADNSECEERVKICESADLEDLTSSNLHKRRVTFCNVEGDNSDHDEAGLETKINSEPHSNLTDLAASAADNTGWNTTEIFLPKRLKKRIRTVNTALMNLKIENDFAPGSSGSQMPDFISDVDLLNHCNRFA